MSSLNDTRSTGQTYWRSLNELAETPEFKEFMHREFAGGAADLLASDDRRSFLKVMGASFALAGLGLAGCRRWPDERIAPYAKRPVGIDPGVPTYFATSMEIGGIARGLIATAFDGRPIKMEGNPDDPIGQGATTLFDQASVLDLYDPDRSRAFRGPDGVTDWDHFVTWAQNHFGGLRGGRGAGIAVLSEAIGSPSARAMKTRFLAMFPEATWTEYEPIADDNQLAGLRTALGGSYRAMPAFDKARLIVSLDDDFLGASHLQVKSTRDYARGRRATDRDRSMNRLYSFESGLSITGANADHRSALRSADVRLVAAWLAARVTGNAQLESRGAVNGMNELVTGDLLVTLERLAGELESHHGDSLITVGPRQPAEVHALAAIMNAALGNAGKTVGYIATDDETRGPGGLQSLVEAIDASEVSTLLILGCNPVYDAPADLTLAAAIGRVPHSIHLSHYDDETSAACTWHLSRAHYLESWGDGRLFDGTVVIRQPLIESLFGGRSELEVLAAVTGDDLTSGYDIVRRSLATEGETAWQNALKAGVVSGSAASVTAPASCHRCGCSCDRIRRRACRR